MPKENSKYYNTAKLMDEALLDLIAKKDFDLITVKELCAKAGVNRSTFYLHYETMNDLLEETNAYLMESVYSYYPKEGLSVGDLMTLPKEKLLFFTPDYLLPYLRFIKEHQKIFKTVLEHNQTLKGERNLEALFESHFKYIYERFSLDEETGNYMSSFLIGGTLTLISAWLRNGCKESEEEIAGIICRFVPGIS